MCVVFIRKISMGFVEDPEAVAMEELFTVKENDLIVNITFAYPLEL